MDQAEIYKRAFENIRTGIKTILEILHFFPEKSDEAIIIFKKVSSISTLFRLDLNEYSGNIPANPLFEEEINSVSTDITAFIYNATLELDQKYKNF